MFPPEPRYENGNGLVSETMIDSADQVNNTRSQEIMGKAVSSMLLLLLKWFRVSREFRLSKILSTDRFLTLVTDVLRYEYLTQLLLDTNYVPLFIKIWSGADIGRACHFKLDKEESK